jgi:transcriptional regulator with XRE-family HTH domain
MKIGNRLKALRTEKGFSAAQVAEKLDISETTYRRYEADKTFPDIFTIDKLAKMYDKDFIELLPDSFTVNQNNNEVAIVQNYASFFIHEKLIEQYEKRIENLEEQLEYWKNK